MHNHAERYDFYPFPFVQTDARRARNTDVLKANATVTAETEFFLLWRAGTPCYLNVLHAERNQQLSVSESRYGQSRWPTRIRIDSLALAQQDATILPELRSQANLARPSARAVYQLFNHSLTCVQGSRARAIGVR